ncbi:MAG TPA: ComEC/Rec2 family competence protein [Candidatus Baltobacteraceae bacterium]|nr:ComEC/Rec2 family competence protein [Candidatus Baltobacteraceae bacterium]
MDRFPLLPIAVAVILTDVLVDFEHPIVALGIIAVISLLPIAESGMRIAGTMLACLALLNALRPIESPQITFRQAETIPAVVMEAHRSGYLTRAVVRLEGGGMARVTIPHLPAIGERLVLRGEFEPFDDARNPGEPSLRMLEAEQGIVARIAHPLVLSHSPPNELDPSILLARWRDWAGRTIRERVPEPEATILASALWGEKGELPSSLHDDFQATGTIHVLVTAGLHVGAVAAVALWITESLAFDRVVASLVPIPIVWLFALVSGAHLPALRAAVMATMWLLSRALGRESSSPNALAAAAIVVGLLWPHAPVEPSFLLSFACVGAILTFAAPLTRRLRAIGLPSWASEAGGLALATQLGTWPLVASVFLVIAPYSVFANLVVVPLIALAIPLGLLLLTCAPLPPLADVIAQVETMILNWVVTVVHCVASLPFARIPATPPPAWTIVTYGIAIALLPFLWRRGRPRLGLACVAATCLLVLEPPRSDAHELLIRVIDVGRGESIAIRTPAGHAFLIDAGRATPHAAESRESASFSTVAERTVIPQLVRMGIHHLDAIILTSPQQDARGILAVMRLLGTDSLVSGMDSDDHDARHEILAEAQRRHIPVVPPTFGASWQSNDDITFRFLAPLPVQSLDETSSTYENSAVISIGYRAFRMLFLGEAGTTEEHHLIASGVDLHADVLALENPTINGLPSDAFVETVHPRATVISIDHGSRTEAPESASLERITGAATYRTDTQGAITIHSDGTQMRIEAFLSGGSDDEPLRRFPLKNRPPTTAEELD